MDLHTYMSFSPFLSPSLSSSLLLQSFKESCCRQIPVLLRGALILFPSHFLCSTLAPFYCIPSTASRMLAFIPFKEALPSEHNFLLQYSQLSICCLVHLLGRNMSICCIIFLANYCYLFSKFYLHRALPDYLKPCLL